jgi:hypothetical protein
LKCVEQVLPIVRLQLQDIKDRLDTGELETEPQIVVGNLEDYPVQHGAAPQCCIQEMFR